ncbi:UNVERIFIED_CONTAM: Myb family transcription factor IPN2 [Sesamum latifolium]|uniref:Myb family transcription factor IPN2 n=1 Tax=Sesamum latifolium TaxID=2727402 RepID=A0AAW2WMY5_9LAMI
MFHPKQQKPSSMNSHHERPMCVQGDSGLVLTTDPKPRLRWTVELHERFVDAVTQLGRPDKATPKTIMRVMGVKGLTLYHLKSHLQKFRLGKQPHKDFNDHSMKDGERASSLELQRNNASSSGILGRSMNDGSNVHITDAIRMQMEVNRRLHEQLEVQRHLQLRIEAQGKYMQTILEKACQTLAGENMASGSYNKAMGPDHISGIKDFGPAAMNFPSLQDLNIYGGTDHLELHHQNMDRSSIDPFMHTNNDGMMLGKKRPNPYSNNSGKSPLIWADDLRLQELELQRQHPALTIITKSRLPLCQLIEAATSIQFQIFMRQSLFYLETIMILWGTRNLMLLQSSRGRHLVVWPIGSPTTLPSAPVACHKAGTRPLAESITNR